MLQSSGELIAPDKNRLDDILNIMEKPTIEPYSRKIMTRKELAQRILRKSSAGELQKYFCLSSSMNVLPSSLSSRLPLSHQIPSRTSKEGHT